MSIDLPPPMPPVLADMEHLVALYKQKAQPFVSGTVGSFHVEVIGFPYLRKGQVTRLMEASKTPSQFITALNKSYHRNGNLLIQLLYRQKGDTVYVYVLQSKLKSVTGPEAVAKHFRGLAGERDLSVAEFDRSRVLADVKSRRLGVNYSISYQVSEDYSSVVMSLDPSPVEIDRSQFYQDTGNQGNRYVGRYFAGAGLSHISTAGTEFSLDYMTALVNLGETDGGKSYNGGVFSANYPSTFGLNSVEVTYSTYKLDTTLFEVTSTMPLQQDLSSVCSLPQDSLCPAPLEDSLTMTEIQTSALNLDAETASLVLGSEQVIFSNPRRRISLMQRLEWVSEEMNATGHGVVLDEAYGVLGVGGKYIVNNGGGRASSPSYLQLFIKTGVGSDSGTLGTETDEGIVAIGKRTAQFVLIKPEFRLGANLGSSLRISLDVSGQYSDGSQVPQTQQYILGGISGISAYLPGVLVGDSGAYGKLSLSGFGIGGRILKFTPSLFVEHGRVQFEDVTGSAADVRAISDAGIRFSMEMGSAVKLDLVAAKSFQEENLPEHILEDFEVDFFARVRIAL